MLTEYIVGALAGLCVVLLGYLINQVIDLGKKIDSLTAALTTKVNIADCSGIREGCINLNKRLIYDPLKAEIDVMRTNSVDHWLSYAEAHKKIWDALDNHTHSQIPGGIKDDEVIYKK
jgi:hypothetical protein